MKILLLAASLRKESYNKKLINLIYEICREQKIKVEILDFSEFSPTIYNGDIEEKTGIPESALLFAKKLNDAAGLIISSPEYNYSTPGTLKNLIDWVSRSKPMPWLKYPIMLCSASPSMVGGNRGLLHTATVLQSCCRAHVFSSMFSLPEANNAFENNGSLKNKNLEENLNKNIHEFFCYVNALKQITC